MTRIYGLYSDYLLVGGSHNDECTFSADGRPRTEDDDRLFQWCPPSASPSARDRLLDAVAELAVLDGFGSVSVERVLARARVSRSTFYQYFRSVEDCFWDAYDERARRLLRALALARSAGGHPQLAVLEALGRYALERPLDAQLLMREGLAAAPRGLRERDAFIGRIEGLVAPPPPSDVRLDVPPALLVGGLFRFLTLLLALPDVPDADELTDAIRGWARLYLRPTGACWSERLLAALPRTGARLARQLPRPSRSLPARARILRGTAATVRALGYRVSTVADIAAAAGVSRRTFYNEFHSVGDAFIAAYEDAFTRTIAACAPAYFTPGSWPQRVWNSATAFTRFFAAEPALAYVALVDCHAPGPRFLPRVRETQLAFTFFLQEGHATLPAQRWLPTTCAALCQGVIFETAFNGCRAHPALYARPMQPLAVYVTLVPFIGAQQAHEFVASRLSADASGG